VKNVKVAEGRSIAEEKTVTSHRIAGPGRSF